jgi:hypothetical protein
MSEIRRSGCLLIAAVAILPGKVRSMCGECKVTSKPCCVIQPHKHYAGKVHIDSV